MHRNPCGNTFQWSLAVMTAVALLSLATFFRLPASALALTGLAVLFAALALWKTEIAFLVLLGELFAGATGNLFSTSWSGVKISLRLILFVLFFTVWVARLRRHELDMLIRHPLARWFLLFLAALVLGVAVGLFSGNALKTVFLDANGFVAVLLFPIFLTQLRTPHSLNRALQVLFAATIFHAAWTLILLFVFSSHTQYVTEVYKWIRDSRIYEITEYPGNFFRVFSSAHFFVLLGTLLAAVYRWSRDATASPRRNAYFWIFFFGLATLFVGASRSFWFALLLVLAVALALFLRRVRPGVRETARAAGTAAAIVAASFALIAAIIAAGTLVQGGRPALPLAALEARVAKQDDPSVAHRFVLLAPLLRAIAERPVLGSGFGRTITFVTPDPRTVERTGGVRTTFAFEWGYLDLLLKLGVFGAAAVVVFVLACLRFVRRALLGAPSSHRPAVLGLLLGGITLAVLHSTTPFLNHPLGLGMLAFAVTAATVTVSAERDAA